MGCLFSRIVVGAVAFTLYHVAAGATPAGPVLHSDKGSYSFAGLRVPMGAISPSTTVFLSNAGRAPLRNIAATTSGDFVVTSNTCSKDLVAAAPVATLSPASLGARCSIAVAFKPTANGLRSGGLILSADGVGSQTVALDGGAPIRFPSVAVGASSLQWVELPATAALSASVNGPFAIALQPSYAAGAINRVTFAATSSTSGVCPVPSGTPCSLYLGIELLPDAPIGTSTGTVTLSNGVTYSVTADVLGPTMDVEPATLDLGSIPLGSRSDATAITVTNLSNTAFMVAEVSVTGPYSASSTCPTSLAAQASCVVNVAFVPTAIGAAAGFAQLSTGEGNVGIALIGTGIDNPADIGLSPATLNLPLLASNASGNRRITITNLSAAQAVTIGAPTGNICASGGTQCLDFTANTCTTLSAGDNCQFSLHYVGVANEASGADILDVPVTVGSITSQYSVVVQHQVPTATAPTVMVLSTTDLRFPATTFDSASAAQSVTVKNVSAVSLSVAISSIADFIADPTCVPLAPGASCSVAIHFVPTSGNTQASGVLNFVAYDYSTTTNGAVLGTAGVTVSGASISNAALSTPAYPPLVQPLPFDNGFAITNASSVPLIIAGVYGDAAFDSSLCPASLAPGASCTVSMSTGCFSTPGVCHLIIASNSASSPDMYSIAGGQNLEPDDLGVDTSGPLVFAATPVGSTSSVDTINVHLFEYGVDDPFSVPFNVYVNSTTDFTINNGCPTDLVPVADRDFFQTSCGISVQFTPKSAGFKTATITYASSLDTQTILIAGTAPGAGLTLSPASLFLGAPAGQIATQTVTVTNPSSAVIRLSSLAVAGPGAASFSIGSTTCGTSVAAGGSCTIAVVYSMPSVYLATADLLVTTASGLVESVALSGVIPSLVLSGTVFGYFPFGEVTEGKTASTVIVFNSYDDYPITVRNVALKGPNASSYSLVSNTCTGDLLQGVGGQSGFCEIEVEFAPKAVGNLAETLEFTSSIGVTDFDISGTGGPVSATVSPSALDFGSQALATPSAPLTITLTNPNPIALSVYGAHALGGANVGDFTLSGNCSTIPANGTCAYSVVFTPSAAGARTASLPIYAGDVAFYKLGIKPSVIISLVGGGISNPTPGVTLSAASNVDGIGVDGVHVLEGGLDGLSDSYSGTLLGSSLYWSGSYFTFGSAGVANAISSSTIRLPVGNYAAVKVLATAVRSNQPNQMFLVNYTDGTSTAIKQSVSSWTTPQNYFGETIVKSMAYRLNPNGTAHAGTYNLYGYSFALDNTKTVKSLTLPDDRDVVVLGIDLKVTDQMSVDLSKVANVSAVHNDGTAVDGAGIDDLGDAYSAQVLGTALTSAGVTFNLPEVLPVDALANATLALPTGSFSTLHVLATGVQGNQLNHSLTVAYTDGTSSSFKQSFSDWHTPQGFAGETIALSMPYRLNGDGSKHTGTYQVYGYSFPLNAAKTVKSVTLPGVRTVVVLAVTLSP